MTNTVESCAEQITRDIRERRAFRLVPFVGTDLGLAYRIQGMVMEQLSAGGTRHAVGGYKLAFNKPSSFDYYGTTESCSAPVFADRIGKSGAVLQRDTFRQLVIEPEIAAVLGGDLPADGTVTPGQAQQAISHVVAAFELMDVRGAFDRDPSAAEAVAQGIYNVGAVLGTTRLDLDALDATTLPASLTLMDGQHLTAFGAAPQHPVDAVCWLANHLAERDLGLKAGMIVLCGTHLPGQTITQAGSIRLDMGRLGSVDMVVS